MFKKLILILIFSFFAINFCLADYPEKQIQIIVPSQVGSINDITARVISESLSKQYNQNIIVINKPGASTSIGTRYVLNETLPDGYTILFAAQVIMSSITTVKHISFDEFNKSFKLISLIAETPQVLVVKKHKYKSFDELVSKAKTSETTLKYAIISLGGLSQISSEKIKKEFQLTPVIYKGMPDAILALLREEVDFFSVPLNDVSQFVDSNDFEILTTFTHKRLEKYPNIKTFEEYGYERINLKNWTGVFVKKDTPTNIIENLKTHIEKIKTNKDFEKLTKRDSQLLPNFDYDYLEKFLKIEYENYEKENKK